MFFKPSRAAKDMCIPYLSEQKPMQVFISYE